MVAPRKYTDVARTKSRHDMDKLLSASHEATHVSSAPAQQLGRGPHCWAHVEQGAVSKRLAWTQ